MSLAAGQLKHRVILQSPTGSRDSVGERSTTWTNVATVWAAIYPLNAKEQFVAAQMMSSVTHRVIVRYSSDIASIDGSWRVMFGSRIFTIDGQPRNINEENEYLELPCTEGLRTE